MKKTHFRAGDSWHFNLDPLGYTALDGWTMRARLIPREAAATAIDLPVRPFGDLFEVQMKPKETAPIIAGDYSMVTWVERADESITISQTHFVVLVNLRDAQPGTDTRSFARRTLEALIEAKAQWDQSGGRRRKFKIADREVEFDSEAEIQAKIRFWQKRVHAEEGKNPALAMLGRTFYVKASRP